MKALTRIIMCLAVFTIITAATPITDFSMSGKKASRAFGNEVLRVYDGANQFFQSDWERDNIKLIAVASYRV